MKKKLSFEDKTILIVEDVETSIKFFEAALKGTKAKLLYAETGEEAIKLFDENPDISLVLLDLNLPEISGFEVLKYIRKKNNNIPVIVQSAYILSGEKEQSMKLGANYFLEKPIRLDVLLETISNYLS
jgi:CheY-like chemotaxis protein